MRKVLTRSDGVQLGTCTRRSTARRSTARRSTARRSTARALTSARDVVEEAVAVVDERGLVRLAQVGIQVARETRSDSARHSTAGRSTAKRSTARRSTARRDHRDVSRRTAIPLTVSPLLGSTPKISSKIYASKETVLG